MLSARASIPSVAAGIALVLGLSIITTTSAAADEQQGAQEVSIDRVHTQELQNARVTVQGFVTADYEAQGIGGFFVQQAGTGGSPEPSLLTPQAVHVTGAQGVHVGDFVKVTGTVTGTDSGATLATDGNGVVGSAPPADAQRPKPITSLSSIKGSWTDADALDRIAGMLVMPESGFTVAGLDQYGQRGEAALSSLPSFEAMSKRSAKVGDADTRLILDDGAADEYTANADTQKRILPRWAGKRAPRVGDRIEFTAPNILQKSRNTSGLTDGWHFQPTAPATDGKTALPARASGATAPSSVTAGRGDLRVGQVDLGNYFPTAGTPRTAKGADCKTSTTATGVRLAMLGGGGCPVLGAGDDASFARQRAKVKALLTGLKGVNVIALQGLQNDAQVGSASGSTAAGLADLLNGSGKGPWRAVGAPDGAVGPRANAFLYRSDRVKAVGAPAIATAKAFYASASPLAQSFAPVKGAKTATTLVSARFSGQSESDYDGDLGQNQLAGANASQRKSQATALRSWLSDTVAGKPYVVTGNLGSLSGEAPVKTLESSGLTELVDGSQPATSQGSTFAGSQTHVLAAKAVTGAGKTTGTVWGVSAQAAPTTGYASFGLNGSDQVDTGSPERATYENPVVFSVRLPKAARATAPEPSPEASPGAQQPEPTTSGAASDPTHTAQDAPRGKANMAGSSTGGSAPSAGGTGKTAAGAASPGQDRAAAPKAAGKAPEAAAATPTGGTGGITGAQGQASAPAPAQAIRMDDGQRVSTEAAGAQGVPTDNGVVRIGLIGLAIALAIGAAVAIVVNRRRAG